jgi:hypothetical protein
VSDTTTLTTVDNGAPVFGDEVAKFILPLGDSTHLQTGACSVLKRRSDDPAIPRRPPLGARRS